MRRKLRVHLEYLQKIVSVNLVKVAVGKSSNVAARLSNCLVFAHVLSEYVVLAYETHVVNSTAIFGIHLLSTKFDFSVATAFSLVF